MKRRAPAKSPRQRAKGFSSRISFLLGKLPPERHVLPVRAARIENQPRSRPKKAGAGRLPRITERLIHDIFVIQPANFSLTRQRADVQLESLTFLINSQTGAGPGPTRRRLSRHVAGYGSPADHFLHKGPQHGGTMMAEASALWDLLQ